MTKSKNRIRKILPLGIITLIIASFFIATGYHYIPVDISLGSCIKDYTSPSTYTKRVSPLKSHDLTIDGDKVLICYGSPSANERKIFGGIVPYNRIWRFGANEPTRIYTSTNLVLGEVVVPKGRYSIYVIPGEESWEIFLSESTFHWGNSITQSVRDKEIGSFEIKSDYNPTFVEKFTIESGEGHIIVKWESTLLRIPMVNFGD